MADKKSFLMYTSYQEQLALLSDEECGRLMRAVMAYADDHTILPLDGATAMAFAFIRAQMDRDEEAYEERCAKNRENGMRGGRPKKGNSESEETERLSDGAEKTERLQEKPNKTERFLEKPKKPDNDNDDDNDDEDDIITPPTPSKGERRQSIPFAEIMELYNGICTGLPSIRSIEGQRKKAVAARWRAGPGIDGFRVLFDKAQASRFLRGENVRNWTASFDWLMKANNMAKVLEGLYDDKDGGKQNGAGINREHYGIGEQPGRNDQYDLTGFKPPPETWGDIPDEHGSGSGGI